MAHIYGTMAGGSNIGRRGSGSKVGHLGPADPNRKWAEPRGKPWKTLSVEKTTPDVKRLTRDNTQATLSLVN